jgi:hypothetical protein
MSRGGILVLCTQNSSRSQMAEAFPAPEAGAGGYQLGIEPFAWVVNQSFAAATTTDPSLAARGEHQWAYIGEVRGLARRIALVAWQAERPSGTSALLALASGEGRRTTASREGDSVLATSSSASPLVAAPSATAS